MIKVTFVGLSRVRRNLGELKRGISNAAWTEPAKDVSRVARRLVPVLTGRLRASIRVIPKAKGSLIEAGGGLPPYAAVQERGRYNNIRPHYYMRRASNTNVARAAKKDVDKIIRKSF